MKTSDTQGTALRFYTGIGSRKAPPDILADMHRLAKGLAPHFTLRSGAADGADTAFETGAADARGPRDIFLPWKGFNNHPSALHAVTPAALSLAGTAHPRWDTLGQGPMKLHARNMYQVLGAGLDDPSEFVVCWTADGCESSRERSSTTGGTASAIVLAEKSGIPVFNLAKDSSRERLVHLLEESLGLDAGWLLRRHEQKDLF
jgi:hypothetical protein